MWHQAKLGKSETENLGGFYSLKALNFAIFTMIMQNAHTQENHLNAFWKHLTEFTGDMWLWDLFPAPMRVALEWVLPAHTLAHTDEWVYVPAETRAKSSDCFLQLEGRGPDACPLSLTNRLGQATTLSSIHFLLSKDTFLKALSRACILHYASTASRCCLKRMFPQSPVSFHALCILVKRLTHKRKEERRVNSIKATMKLIFVLSPKWAHWFFLHPNSKLFIILALDFNTPKCVCTLHISWPQILGRFQCSVLTQGGGQAGTCG